MGIPLTERGRREEWGAQFRATLQERRVCMPRQTSITVIGEGEALLTSLGDNAKDFQHLEGSRQELQGLVDQAKVLTKEQAAFTASKQDTSKKLAAVLKQIRALINL